MGQQEGVHLDLETEGHISSQVVKNKNSENKAVPGQQLSITLSDTKKCFACNQTSHNLDQCKTKDKLVNVACQFGYATKFPFSMIQPSEETVETKSFYHHCVLITSDVSNLDLGTVKCELQKFWTLSGDWELRRECRKNFLASLSSEGDVISCLKHPKMETLLDDKEVKFTVTRCMEGGNEESLDLIEEWFLVCGVPTIYRKWKELYQVVSAFGVLVEVDEESLEVEDKEPIRLKIALRSLDDAPFSYYFVFGRSSRMVKLTVEPKYIIEEPRLNGEAKENQISAPADTITNSKKTTDSSKPEDVQGQSATSMIGEIEENQTSSPAATMTNLKKTADSSKPEEVQGQSAKSMIGEIEENQTNAPAATITNSKKTTTESSKPEEVQSIGQSATSMIGDAKENQISAPEATITNSKKTTTENSKPEEVQSIGQTPTSMTGEENFRGIPKPPIKHVFKRRGKKQVTEVTNKSPPYTMDKGMGPESSSNANRIGASTGHGVETDQKGSEVQFHEKQYDSKTETRRLQNSKNIGIYGTFSEMGLKENLLKGIHQYGLEKPSPVHQRGIVPLCKGLSVIHQSLSGTTVTLCAGLLQRIDYGSAECQALILVPTPDLAQETKKVIQALGRFLGVEAHTCTEGTNVHADQETLSSKVQVVVGTPRCILDMLQRQALCPDHIKMTVLDEADELLTGGSKDQICSIFQRLPTKIQAGLFSANFSKEALEASSRFMDMRVTVRVAVPRDEELKHTTQYYLEVKKEELKLGKLHVLFTTMEVRNIIIFVNTKDKVMSLKKDVDRDYTVSECHDGMDQHARDTAVQKFLSGSSNILITNDLRGTKALQVPIPIVINYDLPTQPMQYIRRVLQQNGQSGKKSLAISMVTPSDEGTLFEIMKFSNKMRELPSDI